MTDRTSMARAWWESPYQQQRPQGKQKKFAGRFRRGPVILFLSVLTIIPATVGTLALTSNSNEPRLEMVNTWAYPASTKAVLQQCGDTFTFDIQPDQYGLIPDEYEGKTVPRHEHIVPGYGYMTDYVKEGRSFYAPGDKDLPNSPEVMRWMFEGKKVIWYPNAENQETFDLVSAFVEDNDDFVALPWRVEYGGVNEDGRQRELPLERNVGLSAWGITKSCGLWNEDVIKEFSKFVDEHQDLSQYPERTAELTKKGELPLILNR